MIPAIELFRLQKRYRGFGQPAIDALRGIDLEVPKGEVFGLLGPNGAGKSTALWIVMGMLPASGGEARVLGEQAGGSAVYRRIGFQPEDFGFHRFQTPASLFRLYSNLVDPLRWREIYARVGPLMERFGLEAVWKLKLRKFSKGMLQKVALIQALMHDPELIILDEPSANLDPAGRKLVRDIIEEMKRRGKTVVISSHILSEVEAVCDRVAILDKGELKGSFQVAQLLRHLDEWVVDCTPLPPAAEEQLKSKGLLMNKGEHYHRIHVPRSGLWELLDWLHAEGLELLGANPRRFSLEEAYLRVLGQDGGKPS